MEVRALCSSLLVIVFLLFITKDRSCCCTRTAGGTAYPLLVPSRLQFFEYETLKLNCKGLDYSSEWRVMRRPKENLKNATTWETSSASLTLQPAYRSDSGEYWCENEKGERSKSVEITVTAGDVILESPTVPVMKGDSVSLHCRNQNHGQNPSADFFKNGNPIGVRHKGTFTIDRVSKSDEGFYKCSISGGGESPESWLSVRETTEIIVLPPSDGSSHNSLVPSVTLTVLFLAGLLLGVGLLYWRKHKLGFFSSGTGSPGEDFVSGEENVSNADTATYTTIREFHKRKESGSSRCSGEEATTSTANYSQSSGGNDVVVYSAINKDRRIQST